MSANALPFFPWHLQNMGRRGGRAGIDCNVIPAWTITAGDPNIRVAIIDDGFDLTHVGLGQPGKFHAPYDASRRDPDPAPERFVAAHGTACAQLAVGSGAQETPLGVAPRCGWIPIRHDGRVGDIEEAFAFYHALTQHADVVSCSWGALDGCRTDSYPLPESTARTIDMCVTEGRQGKGMPIVFSAGNGNEPVELNGYAANEAVITVSACTNEGRKAPYSSYGDNVWVCAPSDGGSAGVYVGHSATWTGHEFGRTSAATAIVAGVVALMLSANPALSLRAVRNILKDTAVKLNSDREPSVFRDRWGNTYDDGYDARGHSKVYGWGLVNAGAAVAMARRSNELELV